MSKNKMFRSFGSHERLQDKIDDAMNSTIITVDPHYFLKEKLPPIDPKRAVIAAVRKGIDNITSLIDATSEPIDFRIRVAEDTSVPIGIKVFSSEQEKQKYLDDKMPEQIEQRNLSKSHVLVFLDVSNQDPDDPNVQNEILNQIAQSALEQKGIELTVCNEETD